MRDSSETAQAAATADLFWPAFLALALGAIAMGASPIFVRLADVGPFASAFWRVALALPVLWAWHAYEARRPARVAGRKSRAAISPAIFLAGAFFAGDLAFWHLAITHTTVANATFFATTAPIWVVLGSWLMRSETIGWPTVIGLVMALAGGATLLGESVGVAPERVVGDLFGLITAVFFGAYFLAVRAARRHHGPAQITFVSSLVTAALLLLVALVSGDRMLPSSPEGFMILVALALVSHAGGQGLLAFALGHLPATFSSLVIFIEAIAAAVFGWVALGEALSAIQIAGGAVILLGIWTARPRTASAEATIAATAPILPISGAMGELSGAGFSQENAGKAADRAPGED